MLKVLIRKISDDATFRNKAIKILEQQHDGLDVVGEATTADITKIDIRGGIMTLSSASAQKKSA